MVERGEWRADAPFSGHASFHIWAAYSYSPNATWGQIASEFVKANKGGSETLKTFVNTVLGETWVERGDAPDWLRLYERRERYEIGTVPKGVVLLTAGVDVQKDRLVYEVVGWGEDRQSWSIDAGVIPGDTAKEEGGPWDALDALLGRSWPDEAGNAHAIRWMGIDSGYNTQTVYNWARRNPARVIACKGVSTAKTLLGAPTAVDVTLRGKRIARGAKVWPVGVDLAKAEFYGWLRLERPTAESGVEFPPGFCHFPEHGEDFFKQITAEHLLRVVKRTGFVSFEWACQPGRENHWLDSRVYARAAAALAGLDRFAAAARAKAHAPAAPQVNSEAQALPEPPESTPPRQASRPGWLTGGRGGTVARGGWLRRR
jgi:phage terminase large subunit GpA-like protein